MLAPRSTQKFLSYITGKYHGPYLVLFWSRLTLSILGWLTVSGWQAVVASGAFLSGTLVQGLIVLVDPAYTFEPWHGTLLFWTVVFFSVFINTIVSGLLPKFEGLILILHLTGFFAIMIPLVVLGPHDNSQDVFTTFINSGGWPTQGVSFFVGLLGNVFAFFGTAILLLALV